MSLVLFPGLGADGRMYSGLRCPGVEIVTPDWPDPAPRPSLTSYARSLADGLGIGPDTAVGGSSFGGFVAAEIAAQRRVRALVLIGSALSPGEIPSYYAVLERLSRMLSEGLFDRAPRNNPLVLAKFGRLTAPQRALFLDMAGKASAGLLQRGLRMIFDWEGVRREDLTCPLHRLHGRLDRLIRPPSNREAEIVAGGGHLIAMTHPGVVSRFLRRTLES
jgi:pimeloyl-ACP methyl ester carboxylesterase